MEGDSSEYFCSIVRLSIQAGNSLPLFIPRIETGQSDINKTVYKVTLTCAVSDVNYSSTMSVLHYTSDTTAILPPPPISDQDMSGTYYYHYNVQTIVKMFNDALKRAWNDIATKLPARFPVPVPLPAGSPDQLLNVCHKTYVLFFKFDSDNYRLVLNVDKDFLNSSFDKW